MDPISWPKYLFFSFLTLLILFSFLWFDSAAATSLASCHSDQRSALLELKEGFIRSNLTSWQPGTDCCSDWEGISCDESSGHVTILDLSNHNIEGNLSVAIPPSIGKLVRLHRIYLKDNSLHGPIPQSLFALPNLHSLDLSYNKLSGQFRLEQESSVSFPPLTHLDLRNNQLTGSISGVIYKLSNLEILNSSGNQFSGPIPNSIFGLASTQVLDLAENNFNGTFKLNLLQHLRNLTTLYLSNNQLSVEDVSDEDLLLPFPRISSFGFVSCNLSHIPRLLSYHDGLTEVDFSNNHLHGVIPSWIWEKFAFIDHLFFNMSYNKFTSVENISTCHVLPVCQSFGIIDFSFNKIRGRIPLIGADNLDYANNELLEIPSNHALYLQNTRYLWLSANKLTGDIPTSMFETPNLQVLDLSRNNFRGLIPSNIFQAPILQILLLGENKFQGIVHHQIEKTCQLLILDLSNNIIDGKHYNRNGLFATVILGPLQRLSQPL